MGKKPTVLMILDGYGLNKRADGNAVAEAKDSGNGQADGRVPVCKRKCERHGGRASGRADGKFRGRAFKYGRRAHCVPGAYKDYEGN